ncbi:hypothetical protein C5167_036059 [Papaver somniferum]|nr:hypothetical protein C5167_036059 [Papaver somniferum]
MYFLNASLWRCRILVYLHKIKILKKITKQDSKGCSMTCCFFSFDEFSIEAIESIYPVVTVNASIPKNLISRNFSTLLNPMFLLLFGDAFTVSEVASPVVAP